MDRVLTKTKITDYLKNLTAKNVDLVHYVGNDPEELINLLDRDEGPTGAIFNFYAYRWKLDGNAQRTFNDRTIHFSVMIPGVDL